MVQAVTFCIPARYTGGMATLHIDPLPRNATAGEVLRFVCDATGLDGKLVGKITLLGEGASVELPDSHALKAVTVLDGTTFRERRVRVRFATAIRDPMPVMPRTSPRWPDCSNWRPMRSSVG